MSDSDHWLHHITHPKQLCPVCPYLVQAGLVKRLATAGVITHLVRDGIFQTIRVTDPTLGAEALRKHTCTDVEGQRSWAKACLLTADLSSLFLSHERTARTFHSTIVNAAKPRRPASPRPPVCVKLTVFKRHRSNNNVLFKKMPQNKGQYIKALMLP